MISLALAISGYAFIAGYILGLCHVCARRGEEADARDREQVEVDRRFVEIMRRERV